MKSKKVKIDFTESELNLIIKMVDFSKLITDILSKKPDNFLIDWEEKDATRNSISSVAQSLYSQKELLNKSSNVQQEMIFQKGINWNDYPDGCKRGRIIIKEQYQKGDAMRSRWISVEPPVFTQDRDFLNNLIP